MIWIKSLFLPIDKNVKAIWIKILFPLTLMPSAFPYEWLKYGNAPRTLLTLEKLQWKDSGHLTWEKGGWGEMREKKHKHLSIFCKLGAKSPSH